MLKIFCVYFDDHPILQSDCVMPIQAGRARTGCTLPMCADDTGDSISAENVRYGEMTAWYWVWKNYLPQHAEVDYVGFSHYRRFLDFTGSGKKNSWRTTYRHFMRLFNRGYCERNIRSQMKSADIVMRKVTESGFATLREEFMSSHPENVADFDHFTELLFERFPDKRSAVEAVLQSGRLTMELQFLMRREYFCLFMEWAFELCRAFEKRWPWSGPTDGPRARAPAFLIERLFLVWLAILKTEHSLAVMELPMIKLTNRPWWYFLTKPIRVFMSERARAEMRQRYR